MAVKKRRKRGEGLYEIRDSGIQGRGVFAKRRIRAGQRVVEYAGERISNDEADTRYDDEKMQRHHTFLFTLGKRTVVDGNSGGNDSRYINHSCDPNCEAVIEKGRIWIYARKNIQPGAELAYDYRYERTGEGEDEKFYVCQCGSPKCRGSIMKPARKTRQARKTRKARATRTARRSRP
jgi:SET domain-containing protein